MGRDEVSRFLENDVPKLEDYEIDLLFSPLFTPSLREQVPFAELLGATAVPPAQWGEIEDQLLQMPARGCLITEDGLEHRMPLRTVTIERFVHRLRLEAVIPERLFKIITSLPETADRPLLKAIARRAIWELPSRREILERFLTRTGCGDGGSPNTTVELLKLIELYQPPTLQALLERIPRLIEVARNERTTAANPKPFFSQRIHEMHGGGRDQRHATEAPVTAKDNEILFLRNLGSWLA